MFDDFDHSQTQKLELFLVFCYVLGCFCFVLFTILEFFELVLLLLFPGLLERSNELNNVIFASS